MGASCPPPHPATTPNCVTKLAGKVDWPALNSGGNDQRHRHLARREGHDRHRLAKPLLLFGGGAAPLTFA